jgi:hypothetical protein
VAGVEALARRWMGWAAEVKSKERKAVKEAARMKEEK